MTNYNERLDKILRPRLVSVEADERLDGVYDKPIYVSDADEIIYKAKQELNAIILEEVLAMIGENEKTHHLGSPEWNYVGGQNALRNELRTAARAKWGEK